jgi:hypothetical protein
MERWRPRHPEPSIVRRTIRRRGRRFSSVSKRGVRERTLRLDGAQTPGPKDKAAFRTPELRPRNNPSPSVEGFFGYP